jgi:L-serine dehydratase
MSLSVFDMFSIGIGPSSSHTVGPMRAASRFVQGLEDSDLLLSTASVRVELFGSLGATGHGHGSDKAIVLGLSGETPEHVDPSTIESKLAQLRATGRLSLLGSHEIDFNESTHIIMNAGTSLPLHPNGMQFSALGRNGVELKADTYYSVGGGFVIDDSTDHSSGNSGDSTSAVYPFSSGLQLLDHCRQTGLPISGVVLANELVWRSREDIWSGLLHIWEVMQQCVVRGCQQDGVLPGPMNVRRRAPDLFKQLTAGFDSQDALRGMDWVTLYALAVNEENAAGGRVVTAPTNGAAGIIPAVLHYLTRFVAGADDDAVVRFLLTAGAIGLIYKMSASISGAEVGCQGEVGSACSMAAAAMAEALGGTPEQAENAAEIGMEHNLGLTCDPVGGLVQIPCIERNAIASVQAIASARTALRGDGQHVISLDTVIKTMRETGANMNVIYKETSRGGLAVNFIEC